jgi:hypothetical protein
MPPQEKACCQRGYKRSGAFHVAADVYPAGRTLLTYGSWRVARRSQHSSHRAAISSSHTDRCAQNDATCASSANLWSVDLLDLHCKLHCKALQIAALQSTAKLLTVLAALGMHALCNAIPATSSAAVVHERGMSSCKPALMHRADDGIFRHLLRHVQNVCGSALSPQAHACPA